MISRWRVNSTLDCRSQMPPAAWSCHRRLKTSERHPRARFSTVSPFRHKKLPPMICCSLDHRREATSRESGVFPFPAGSRARMVLLAAFWCWPLILRCSRQVLRRPVPEQIQRVPSLGWTGLHASAPTTRNRCTVAIHENPGCSPNSRSHRTDATRPSRQQMACSAPSAIAASPLTGSWFWLAPRLMASNIRSISLRATTS